MTKDTANLPVVIDTRPKLPSPKEITPIQQVAGENIKHYNLRDHKELHGMKFIAVKAKVNTQGDPAYGGTPFVTMTGWVYPEGRQPDEVNDLCTITTGSENIFNRIVDALNNNALPVSGILRNSGRAWFLD